MSITEYCEFVGNKGISFDEIPKSEKLCEFASFAYCTRYNEPLKEDNNGWRLCCEQCEIPRFTRYD